MQSATASVARVSPPPTVRSVLSGRSRPSRRGVLTGVGLGALFFLSVCAVAAGMAPSGGLTGKTTGSGGCPSYHAIANFLGDPNLTAGFVLTGNGSGANSTFGSDNESSSNGVPGLIEYCVYPTGQALPSAATAAAIGADGSPFVVHMGSSQGYFSFGRANGNPTNVPLNGAQAVAMGNATWTTAAPTNQTIVLHINDPTECAALYGGNPGTCFVIPGLGTPTQCSQPGVAPAALDIVDRALAVTAPSGATVALDYELAIVNYSSSDSGVVISTPTVDVHLPLASGNLTAVVAPSATTVTAPGWSAPIGKIVTLSGSTAFSTTARPWLSTANLAVLETGGPANLSVEFRWGWSLNVSGTVTSHWSTPKANPGAPYYPSIFAPAPYVGVVSTRPAVGATAGSYFGIVLNGSVGSTSFRTLIETTTGVELHCQVERSGAVSTFEAGVPLTYGNGAALPAGNYVIHIHDAMGAIVRQVQVSVA